MEETIGKASLRDAPSPGKQKNALQGLFITVNNLVLPPLCIRNPIVVMGHLISERVLVSASMGSCAVVFILLATNTVKDSERN
jgi:hypothetical protein